MKSLIQTLNEAKYDLAGIKKTAKKIKSITGWDIEDDGEGIINFIPNDEDSPLSMIYNIWDEWNYPEDGRYDQGFNFGILAENPNKIVMCVGEDSIFFNPITKEIRDYEVIEFDIDDIIKNPKKFIENTIEYRNARESGKGRPSDWKLI